MDKTRSYGAPKGANSDDRKPRRMGAQPGGKSSGRYGSASEGRAPRREGGFSSEGRPPRREGGFSGERRPDARSASRRDDNSFSGEAREPRRENAGYSSDTPRSRPVRRPEGGGHFSESRSQRPGAFRDRDGGRPSGGFRREERKPFERRPRIDRGPWSESAYKVTEKPSVRPVGAPAEVKRAPIETKTGDGKERLQKVLARSGVASRRNAEVLILEGAVTVNGRTITELGTKVDQSIDKIKVNGKLIYTDVEPIYAAVYKPRGVISSLGDPEGRPHIGQIVASLRERVVPIGRLDFTSEGLILMTNDGDLAERIFKERELPKLYMVKVKGHPTEKDLEFLKRGIFSAEGVVRFASYGVEQTLRGKSWLKLEVTDGSKLDLRELLNHRGLLVDRIVRTAIGRVNIHGLNPGEYRLMKRQDFLELLK